MARQREPAAFQNTAPVQRNDTSSFEKLRFAHRATKTALADPSKTRFHDECHWHTLVASPRTVADSCGRLRTLEQLLANTASTPRPPLITRTLCYAFGKNTLLKLLPEQKVREPNQQQQQLLLQLPLNLYVFLPMPCQRACLRGPSEV